jgi:hypothetical protein
MSCLHSKPLPAGRGRVWEPNCERTRVGISPAAAGVPHQAHEGLALAIREIREESKQVSEIGGHPEWSGIWSGIFLDCSSSRGFRDNSTARGGI